MLVEKGVVHFPGIEGGQWIQGKLSNEDFKGLVTLVDFWDYSCVSCIRTLDYIKEWHERYAHLGLLVLGVHTPEFAFGHERRNVLRGVHAFDIPYPVVLDNDYKIWNAFSNRYWPAKYLFDTEGYLRYHHFGEGAYADSELAVQSLLRQRNSGGDFGEVMKPVRDSDVPGAALPPSTPELYLGLERGKIGNEPAGSSSGAERLFVMPGQVNPDIVYLIGQWSRHRQYAQSGAELEGHILVHYTAAEVNLVMQSRKGSTVYLMQDGRPVRAQDAGEDVRFEGEHAIIQVREPRMYQMIQNESFGSHLLSLSTSDPGLEAYVFTFVSCPTLRDRRQ
ncbi:MAG TPA: redoxin domain-containing protein [Acidobacteriota bacterium]